MIKIPPNKATSYHRDTMIDLNTSQLPCGRFWAAKTRGVAQNVVEGGDDHAGHMTLHRIHALRQFILEIQLVPSGSFYVERICHLTSAFNLPSSQM